MNRVFITSGRDEDNRIHVDRRAETVRESIEDFAQFLSSDITLNKIKVCCEERKRESYYLVCVKQDEDGSYSSTLYGCMGRPAFKLLKSLRYRKGLRHDLNK